MVDYLIANMHLKTIKIIPLYLFIYTLTNLENLNSLIIIIKIYIHGRYIFLNAFKHNDIIIDYILCIYIYMYLFNQYYEIKIQIYNYLRTSTIWINMIKIYFFNDLMNKFI